MLKGCWSRLLLFAARWVGKGNAMPAAAWRKNANSTWLEWAQGQKQADYVTMFASCRWETSCSIHQVCAGRKAKQKKNPLDEEPYLSTGYFYHLRTHLFLQIKKDRFLPPRANNQSTNSKDTFRARATALRFTARHGPRRTNGIVECGRAIPTDVHATLKLGTQVFLKPILISSYHSTGPKFLNPFLLFVLKQSWQMIGLLIYRTVHQAWLPWKTCFPNYFIDAIELV